MSFSLSALTAVLGLGLPVLYRLHQVLRAAAADAAAPADLVVVLGRTLRNDRPTAVFRARLDHAHRLVASGLAPRVLVTGGLTGDARITEAEAGALYLEGQGLDPRQLLVEARSRHTLENLSHLREMLRREGWQRAIVVSDPLHLGRVQAYAAGFQLDLLPSPAPGAPPPRGSLGWWGRAIKEAYFVHWYHVGVAYSRAIRSRRLLERVT